MTADYLPKDDAEQLREEMQRTEPETEKPTWGEEIPEPDVSNQEWIAEHLASLDFVAWDRFTIGEWNGECVSVYGWIDRPDEHADFILVIFWPEKEELYFTTSAARYTDVIYHRLIGGNPDEHEPCHRVEDAFGVPNSIKLDGQK